MPKKRRKRTIRRKTTTKSRPMSVEYLAYLKSPEWKAFCENLKRMWDWRCAICNKRGSLQVHHRTYLRLGRERLTDCIPVCIKPCHGFADKRRQIAARQERKSK